MVGKKAPRKPKCTANSEKISQVTGSSTAPDASSAWLTTPLMPRTERQTMTRAAGLRKKGTVSAVVIAAWLGRAEARPALSCGGAGCGRVPGTTR